MSCAATKTLVMNFCGLVPISLYVLSACAHAWLLVEVNPSRDTCTAIAYETIAVLVINVLLLAGGAFHGCAARGGDIAQTLKPFMPIGLAALAAAVLVIGSRLTLFVYEAHRVCSADVASAPSDDLLVDESRRSRAGTAAWFGVVLLGAALLLQHVGVGCGDDYDDKKDDEEETEPFGRRTRRRFTAW